MNSKNDFVVPLNPTEENKSLYRAADENIIRVEIQLPSGELVKSSEHIVVISLSKDAMLGLGSSLIRAALKTNENRGCWEFERVKPDSAIEQLGVYLHPLSSKLILNLTPLGKCSDLL
jgi:hypothetical protein